MPRSPADRARFPARQLETHADAIERGEDPERVAAEIFRMAGKLLRLGHRVRHAAPRVDIMPPPSPSPTPKRTRKLFTPRLVASVEEERCRLAKKFAAENAARVAKAQRWEAQRLARVTARRARADERRIAALLS